MVRRILGLGVLALALLFGAYRLSHYNAPQLLGVAHWTVEPPGIALTFDRVRARPVKPGSIILLHDGGGPRENSIAAVDRLIPLLRERGFRFVDVPY